MSLSIHLPDSLEQQLAIYCRQHQLSKNDTIRLALERLLTSDNPALSPYELGKDDFGADEGDTPTAFIAEQLEIGREFMRQYHDTFVELAK